MVRLVGGAVAFLFLLVAPSASAHTPDVLSEYGTAVIDGVISPGEYGDGCIGPVTETAGPTGYSITICEQNDEKNDYYAIQIGDLTNDTGQLGDSPMLWFDNDHSGTVLMSGSGCTYGQPDEDQIGWEADLFVDGFYCRAPEGFTDGLDLKLPFDGSAQRKFVGGQGATYEFSHPLDSGDVDDYSLALHSTVGWCLTYDDHSNSQPNNPGFAFGEIQYPHGCFVDFATQNRGLVRGDASLDGDVFKQSALDEALEKVRDRLMNLVAICKHCPPDPTEKLKGKINEVIKELSRQQKSKALKSLRTFVKLTHGFVDSGELPAGKGKTFLKAAKSPIALVKGYRPSTPVATQVLAGGVHTNLTRVPPSGVAR
jgi:hypothetical protein